jgi:dipeptidyl aminopeptidase/acylaminoacyl peptidase
MKWLLSTAAAMALTSPVVAQTQSAPIANGTEPAAPVSAPATNAPASIALKDIPVQSFAKIPFISRTQISPNGKMIAGLLGVGGEQRIAAFNLFGEKVGGINMAVPDKTQISWIRWVNDDNLLVGASALLPVETDNWYISRVFAINVTTQKITKLLWDLKGQNGGDVVWVPSDGSNDVLIAAQNSIYGGSDEFWPSVYKVNITNGKKTKAVYGKTNVMDWSVDAAGNVRAGIGYDDATQTSQLYYRPGGSGNFKVIDRAKLKSDENLKVPFLYIPGTNNGLVIHDNKDGQSAIYEMDMATGSDVRTVFEPKVGEVDSVMVSYDGTKLLGATTTASDNNVHWFDPAMAEMQSNFDKSVKNGKTEIVSFNRDQTKMILRVNRPDNPGSIYYFDTNEGVMSRIATTNDAIGGRALSPVKMIKYTARDGLGIEGVLTLPKGKEPKNLPFIVMPHGGPWGQDTLDYDYWTQFLASRGYAVLQPNFRGSTGYGTEFLNKGKGQMGFAMQDDITDGVKWAVAQGIADPKRTCIVGASYGGYAAMWGVVKDPDLYRCSISIAGVAALRREVNDFGGSIRSNLYRRQWKEMTPDFNAVSPIFSVDKIKVPMLLIHGKKDITVDHVQSEKMFGAMKKAGKVVEFVSVPLADHYFTREADRVTLLTAMEAFLAKHNPAD